MLQNLRSALSSGEPLDRVDALENIGALRDEPIRLLVIDALGDPHPLVRLAAAEALGEGGAHDDARRALRDFVFREPDDLAAAHGLSSLGRIGGPADVRLLLELLGSTRSTARRLHAAAGLVEAATRLAHRLMSQALSESETAVRAMAAAALAETVGFVDEYTIRAVRLAAQKETDEETRAALARVLVGLEGDAGEGA